MFRDAFAVEGQRRACKRADIAASAGGELTALREVVASTLWVASC
jgi:hypothetical protein